MERKDFPNLETILPTSLWERLAGQYRRATALSLLLLDSEGRFLRGEGEVEALCPAARLGSRGPCGSFHRKIAHQSATGKDAMLFRCPHGFLAFGIPIRWESNGEAPVAVLVGGPALPETDGETAVEKVSLDLGLSEDEVRRTLSGIPEIAPRRLPELAELARMSLEAAARGNQTRERYAQRQAQVMTLFEVASDLAQASSSHELYALALNTLGVLFDARNAAVLLHEAGSGSFRTQTAMGSMERSLLSWTVPADSAPFDTLKLPGTTVVVDDAHILARLGLPEDVERVLAFSLGVGDRPLGALLLFDVALSVDAQQMIRGLAIQLSLAMQNLSLQAELSHRVQELIAVQETSRRFLGCLEPHSLFQTVLEEARKITGARQGSLMVTANGSGEMIVKAVTGMNEKVVQRLRVRPGQGIAGKVFATGEPIVVENVERDPRFQRTNRPRYSTKSFLSIPITLEGRVVGVLNLSDKVSGEIFSGEDLTLLQTLAAQATIAIERSTFYAQTLELRKISITDALTGLLNRRYFQERLAEEVDRATRHGHPLSLIMIDIDHFKLYNDANGHPAGDKALGMVGRALRGGVRAIDVVSRFGGEEFSVILPETRRSEAMEIGERIRQDIENLYFPGEDSLPRGTLTISLGVAAFPEDARDLKSLIQRADRALYQAKAQGRNRIASYSGPSRGPSPEEGTWTKVL